jgi:hypothetical protein
LSLYLHLDRSEVNERTPSNGRVCSMPAKRSGRYGSTPLRYYSAKSTLVLAFHTGKRTGQQPSGITTTVTANQQQQKQQGTSSAKMTSPSDHHGDIGPTFSSSTTTTTNNSSGPYGFKGTYRFIRKSRNTTPCFALNICKLFLFLKILKESRQVSRVPSITALTDYI